MYKDLKDKVIFEGHYLLTSGNHSNIYFNKDIILTDPDLRAKLVHLLTSKVSTLLPYREGINLVITGPATAGSMWADLIADRLHCSFVYCEKINDKMIFRRGFDKYLNDKDVFVIEDIVTTMGSLNKTIKAIEKVGGNFIGYCCIWDRSGNNPFSIIQETVEHWGPENCPLCKQNIPLTSFK